MQIKNKEIRRGRPKRGAAQIEVYDREAEALSLRREGLSWAEIAERLGYASPSGAYNAYKKSLDRIISPAIEEMRWLENDRLDAIHAAYWDRALEGDLKAVDVILKVHDRRARLNGLNATIKVKSEPFYFPEPIEINAEMEWLLKLRQEHPRPMGN